MPRHFPNWLKAYCQFTEASEAPLDFHFWTGVSTIAAVLQRRVWKDEHLFKWTPNFYIIFVGPAGVVTKSTSLGIGYNMLRDLKDAKGNALVHFGPDSMTWQGLAKEFEKASAYHTYTDPKTKKDEKVLMAPLTCSVSELGTFLRPDDSSLISFLTDVWDGKERPYQHVTSASGNISLENPWLNIIAATTPSWLQNNFPASLIGEGIGSRIIFVFGEQKRHFTAYPSRRQHTFDYYGMQKELIADLGEIGKMIGPYELTNEAYAWGEDWYKTHHTAKNPTMASARYGGYLARKQTHLHKLAMVLSAAKRDALLIEKDDLAEAAAILNTTETSMMRVFENMGIVDEAKHIAELVAFVKGHGWITSEDLWRCCYNIMSKQDFKKAISIACDGDLLEVVKRPTDGKLGLSPKARTIN